MPPTPSPIVAKLKVQLKLAIARLRMLQLRDAAHAKQHRRHLAHLIEQHHAPARIRLRVESLIHADATAELLELLELHCELLLARAPLLDTSTPDPGLLEPLHSLLYAAPRLAGVRELPALRPLLADLYGREFVRVAVDDLGGHVAPRVVRGLRIDTPPPDLVDAYLTTIAEAYGLEWPSGAAKTEGDEPEAVAQEDDGNDGEAAAADLPSTYDLAHATPPRDLDGPSPVRIAPPAPRTDNPRPQIHTAASSPSTSKAETKPRSKSTTNAPGGAIPDVDELARRFAQLKR